jgi:cytochrome P450
MPSILRILQRLMAREGLLRRLGPAMGPWNPWLPEVRRDPYPTYRRLRETAPVVRAPLLGAWIVSRYDDVEHVLRSPHFTTDRQDLAVMRLLRRSARRDPDLLAFLEHDLLMIDGAKHTRLRKLVSKAFTPRRVAALRPRVESLVGELLDAAAARGDGRMDVVADLAAPLPATVIGEMLGVPAEDRDRLHHWSHELVELLDPFSGREGLDPPRRATRALADYFRGLLDERRREPRDDLLSAMLAAEEEGQRLGEDELLALAGLVLVAGHETTTNLIASGVLCLLRHPDERKRLQDDPGLLPSAVEELLRFESPIQLTDRVATEDCEMGGRRIRRGQLVGVLLGSANRDPARFADPDRLDLSRQDGRHLAFGHGGHFCLGAQLARLEGEVALGALLRRFPDLRGPADPPGWKRSIVLRGPTALPIELGEPAAP